MEWNGVESGQPVDCVKVLSDQCWILEIMNSSATCMISEGEIEISEVKMFL